MGTAAAPDAGTEFVDFWNEILVPKFIAYKHVLVDGLTHHSEAISQPAGQGGGRRSRCRLRVRRYGH